MKRMLIGRVGVDAGMLMVGDPCYFIGEDTAANEKFPTWSEFCDWYQEHQTGPNDIACLPFKMGHEGLGIAISTGGDGSFPVYKETRADGSVRLVVELGGGQV